MNTFSLKNYLIKVTKQSSREWLEMELLMWVRCFGHKTCFNHHHNGRDVWTFDLWVVWLSDSINR